MGAAAEESDSADDSEGTLGAFTAADCEAATGPGASSFVVVACTATSKQAAATNNKQRLNKAIT